MNTFLKFTLNLFTFLFMAVPLSSIVYAEDLSTKTITTPAFTLISLETVGDLIVENGTTHIITIEAEPKVLAVMTAKVEGNVLRIFSNGSFSTQKPINLKVKLAKLNGVSSDSSGDILIGKWKTDKLDLSVLSSGSIKASEVNADKIKLLIEGAGDIGLAGHTQNLQVKLEGSGTIDANKLIANTAVASIEGSGDINLNVTNTLNASISGSGTISYFGNPKLTSSIEGAGDIVKRD